MAKVTPTQNTSSQNQDPVVLSTSAVGQLKRAVDGTALTPTGADYNAVAQMAGTHIDAETYTASDVLTLIAALADQTSPGSVAEGQLGYLRMTLARKLLVANTADAAAITTVPSQDTNITILAANALRIGATIFNNDTGVLYLKFGATATATTSNTVKLAAGDYYELPQPVYRGIIDGIWVTSGSGSANVTELT